MAATALHETERVDEARIPDLRPPRPDEVVVWVARLLGELGRAPFTLYRARQALVAVARLPVQIEELIAALECTTSVLETSLPNVEDRLDHLGGTFTGVDGRIQNLERSVTGLSTTITNLIGAIPGARRTLRRD